MSLQARLCLLCLAVLLAGCVQQAVAVTYPRPPVYDRAIIPGVFHVDGTNITLGEYIDSLGVDYFVLTYWVSTCNQCKVQLDLWQLGLGTLRPAGIEVIAVDYGEAFSSMVRALDKADPKWEMPIAWVDQNGVHLLGTPATIVFSRDYKVLGEVYGVMTVEQLMYLISEGN